MQQVCVAQVRGLGKGTAHHLSSVLEVSGSIAPAAFSVSRLAPQELEEQQELQIAVRSGPYLCRVESGLGLPRRTSQLRPDGAQCLLIFSSQKPILPHS